MLSLLLSRSLPVPPCLLLFGSKVLRKSKASTTTKYALLTRVPQPTSPIWNNDPSNGLQAGKTLRTDSVGGRQVAEDSAASKRLKRNGPRGSKESLNGNLNRGHNLGYRLTNLPHRFPSGKYPGGRHVLHLTFDGTDF